MQALGADAYKEQIAAVTFELLGLSSFVKVLPSTCKVDKDIVIKGKHSCAYLVLYTC